MKVYNFMFGSRAGFRGSADQMAQLVHNMLCVTALSHKILITAFTHFRCYSNLLKSHSLILALFFLSIFN